MIFHEDNYKNAIKHILEKKKTGGAKLSYSGMAAACRVQKTYISKVFNADAHLSDDQLFATSRYLELDEDSETFLNLLHQYNRSADNNRKKMIKKKIDSLRHRNLAAKNYVSQSEPTPQENAMSLEYFTDPLMQIIHVFFSITYFQYNKDDVISALKINTATLGSYLKKLESFDLLTTESGWPKSRRCNFLLDKSSPYYKTYIRMHRLHAMESQGENKDPYFSSVVFSAGKEDKAKIQNLYFDFINKVREITGKSKSEEVLQINFDLAKWS